MDIPACQPAQPRAAPGPGPCLEFQEPGGARRRAG